MDHTEVMSVLECLRGIKAELGRRVPVATVRGQRADRRLLGVVGCRKRAGALLAGFRCHARYARLGCRGRAAVALAA